MKKVKKLALIGTLALAMMFGIILHDISLITPGNSRIQAGIILHDGAVTDGVIVPQGADLAFPPGPTKTITQNGAALDYPPGPSKTVIATDI